MSDYEFWDELGKIFNAVVAYQEKSIEFNKRYINPWIRLGNVFDKQDRNREAVAAYQKAIEIDPANAQNWCDLGSAYLRTEAYDQAVHAFLKAIELDPQMGWSYSNLAMAYAAQDNHQEAISLLQKSIELLQDDKDKAVSWNRLGNLYRKLNEYELAVRAFREADALDSGNTGFRDQLDEEPAALPADDQPAQAAAEVVESPVEPAEAAAMQAEAVVEEATPEMPVEVPALDVIQTEEQIGRLPDELAAAMVEERDDVESMEREPLAEIETVQAAPALLDVEDEELLAEAVAEAPVDEPVSDVVAEAPAEEPVAEVVVEATVEEPVAEVVEAPVAEPVAEVVAEAPVEEPVAEAAVEAPVEEPVAEVVEAAAEVPEPAPLNVQDVVETFTESIISMNTATETTDVSLVDSAEKVTAPAPVEAVVPVPVEAQVASDAGEAAAMTPGVPQAEPDVVVEAPAVDDMVAEPAEAFIEDMAPVLEETAAPAGPVMEAAPEAAEAVSQSVEPDTLEEVSQQAAVEPVAEPAAEAEIPVEPAAAAEAAPQEETVVVVEAAPEQPAPEAQPEPVVAEAQPEPFHEQVTETAPVEAAAEVPAETTGQDPQVPEEVAYEEFLKDDGEALNVLTVTPADEPVPAEPLTRVDASGDLQMEMDTRNAHVWNELGNVYFNNGAVDDSIIAYSKAIDLDRYFAWPYSNLALAYVQKQRFNEAVLLYQRSIELFSDDKEKAKSWNRLGNVYRRLNDYEHAIEAYQRADELDPDNTTLALQSRFSLLGSYQVEQTAASAV